MTRVATIAAVATLVAAPAPHPFVWPTSVAVQADGTALVVENGTGSVYALPPHGHARVVAGGLTKAYDVAVVPHGFVVSADGAIIRFAGGHRTLLAPRSAAAARIAIDRSGGIFYSTGSAAYRLGAKTPLVAGLVRPHGIAVTRDGSVLVSDTGRNRVIRVAPDKTVSTFARVADPSGLAVAPDGTVLIVEEAAHRVGRYDAKGHRLRSVGGRFGDPYAVAEARDGTVWVVDTAATGYVRRIAP